MVGKKCGRVYVRMSFYKRDGYSVECLMGMMWGLFH